jgi:hypothetical protein
MTRASAIVCLVVLTVLGTTDGRRQLFQAPASGGGTTSALQRVVLPGGTVMQLSVGTFANERGELRGERGGRATLVISGVARSCAQQGLAGSLRTAVAFNLDRIVPHQFLVTLKRGLSSSEAQSTISQ